MVYRGEGRTEGRKDGRKDGHLKIPRVLQDISPLGPLPKKEVRSRGKVDRGIKKDEEKENGRFITASKRVAEVRCQIEK